MGSATLDLDVSPGTSILVVAPALSPQQPEICADLASIAPPDRERVVQLTLVDGPEKRAGRWLEHVGEVVPCASVVMALQYSRSNEGDHEFDDGGGTGERIGESSEQETGVAFDESTRIEKLTFPPDLTEIGVAFTNVIEGWEGTDEQIVACFDSVSVLLQYTDTRTAAQFVQLLVRMLGNVDAVSHFHLDPGVHDEAAIAAIAQPFDVVCRLADEGEWRISSR